MLCKVGNVEVWRILEINAPFMTPEDLFPDAGPDVAKDFETYGTEKLDPETGRVILPVQGFLLKTPAHVILVDACVGNDKTNRMPAWNMRSDDRFMAGLTQAGVAPTDVDYVLCTHLHPDHVGWNTRLEDGRWVPTFPNARYLMPSADDEKYSELGLPPYNESVLPVIEAGQAEMVTAGHKLGDHVELIPTPGHTPGHVSVLIKDGAAEAVVTGDAIHCIAQCYRPHWHFVFDENGDQAVASRRQLLEDASETGRKVLGTHFSLPSVGRVKAEGDAFRWEED